MCEDLTPHPYAVPPRRGRHPKPGRPPGQGRPHGSVEGLQVRRGLQKARLLFRSFAEVKGRHKMRSRMSSIIELFVAFAKVGLFMFGGGYVGIALMHKEVVEIHSWLSEEEFVEIIGIAESTPGPVAINTATYVGYKVAGLAGSVAATLGVVLPAFLVILLIAASLSRYLNSPLAKTVFRGINAAVVALIFVALLKIGRAVLFKDWGIDLVSLGIFGLALVVVLLLKQHPIVAILASAGLSVALHFLFKI